MGFLHPKSILRLAAWCALVYLGYWLAIVADDVFLGRLIYPWLGAPVLDWRLTPFRAVLNNGDLSSLGARWWYTGLLTFVPGACLLLLAAVGPKRLRSGAAGTWVNLGGLWIVLFFSSQLAIFAFSDRGALARFLSVFGSWTRSDPARIFIALLLFVGLFYAGSALIARLFAANRLTWPTATRWFHLLLLLVPVMVILFGVFGIPFRLFRIRWFAFFSVPAAFCFLLGVLAMRRLATSTSVSSAGPQEETTLGVGRAIALLAVAACLFFGFQQANRAEVLLHERGLATYATPHYEIRYDPRSFPVESVRALGEERERVMETLLGRLRFAGDSLERQFADNLRVRVVLYPDFASKQMATGNDLPHTTEGTTIRALLGGYVERLDPAADAAAVLYGAWGEPGSRLVAEWVARLLAGEWRGRTIEEWAGQIEAEIGHYPLGTLLNDAPEDSISPLVRMPLGAAWIRLIYDQYGLAGVRKLYSAPDPSLALDEVGRILGAQPLELETSWARWVGQLKTPATKAAGPVARPLGTDFVRGISFSHEGWGGRSGGYVGPEAKAQLRRLRELGANAISVVPYGFVRDINATSIYLSRTDETDQELSQVNHTAHRLGFVVMLKPQLWIGWGRFTGEIRLADPTSKERWMRSYREFILHYARLAELERFDVLCIGNELEGMTRNEKEWRNLIAEVRRVYHGPITYAANWGAEFEHLRFWDALDFIGLNNYYPLRAVASGPVSADGSEPLAMNGDLIVGAQALVARIEAVHDKWERPVLFTEVGFPSVRGGSAEPWIEDPRRGIALQEQAAGYEAIFESFTGRPWLKGMFWWKWPSHGRGGGPQDPSYVPLGKPAEEVLRGWYTRLAAKENRSLTLAP